MSPSDIQKLIDKCARSQRMSVAASASNPDDPVVLSELGIP